MLIDICDNGMPTIYTSKRTFGDMKNFYLEAPLGTLKIMLGFEAKLFFERPKQFGLHILFRWVFCSSSAEIDEMLVAYHIS